MIIVPRCQRQQFVADHTFAQLVRGRIADGLGIRTAIRTALKRPKPGRLGVPSSFVPGDWVRIRDEAAVRATLDAGNRMRGLLYSRQMWGFCGHTARVSHVARRIVDDVGRMRAVARTVVLEGVDCDGVDGTQGCGRLCPLLFRDEWLERVDAPVPEPTPPNVRFARVRPLEEIRATLDRRGHRGGLMFMPEMATYVGQRYRVLRKLDRVLEAERVDAIVREPIYILDAPRCTGASLGDDGPCDRRCALLWHGDWLSFET